MSGFDGIPLTMRELVFLDTETTGLDPHHHEVIEVCAVRTDFRLTAMKGIVHRKCRMQWPERASAEALKVNGYTATAWASAHPIRVALVDILALLDQATILVGHNVRFDEHFLEVAFEREELVFPKSKYAIDTVSMAFPLAVAGHLDKLSLETLCSKYGVSNDGKHTAIADVKRLICVYAKLLGWSEPEWVKGL